MKAANRLLIGVLTGVMVIAMSAGLSMGERGVVNAARRTLKNPSRNSDDVVTWDCVYFGNYPQSDATGKTKEPIKWRVLSVEGNDAFLAADQNLDMWMYNDTDLAVTWETCTIRSWLNGYGSSSNICGTDYANDNFMDRAFTDSEQSAIRDTTVENKDHPDYGTDGGKDTIDKVFLLSYDEMTNPVYGFSSKNYEANANELSARKRMNTIYASAGGRVREIYGAEDDISDIPFRWEDGWWMYWLRSPGKSQEHAMIISGGGIFVYGDKVIR